MISIVGDTQASEKYRPAHSLYFTLTRPAWREGWREFVCKHLDGPDGVILFRLHTGPGLYVQIIQCMSLHLTKPFLLLEYRRRKRWLRMIRVLFPNFMR